MGKERTVSFLAGRPDVRVILIDPQMKVSASKDLRGRVTFLEETAVDGFRLRIYPSRSHEIAECSGSYPPDPEQCGGSA
jgi:hypothetical protein